MAQSGVYNMTIEVGINEVFKPMQRASFATGNIAGNSYYDITITAVNVLKAWIDVNSVESNADGFDSSYYELINSTTIRFYNENSALKSYKGYYQVVEYF
jgi:hypothetical protein